MTRLEGERVGVLEGERANRLTGVGATQQS